MKSSGTVDANKGTTMAASSSLPLLPEEGRDFLDGSINTDVYLRHQREKARAKAISEVEREREGTPRSRLALYIILAVPGVINFAIGIASALSGDTTVGFLGIVTGFCVTIFTVNLYFRLRN